jgi:hypothetical protein
VRFFAKNFFTPAASLLLLLVYFKYCRRRFKAFPIDRAEPFVTFDPFFVWHRFLSSKVKPGRVNHSLSDSGFRIQSSEFKTFSSPES